MYHANGKGDIPRPSSLTKEERAKNHARIFLEKCRCSSPKIVETVLGGGYCDICGKSTNG